MRSASFLQPLEDFDDFNVKAAFRIQADNRGDRRQRSPQANISWGIAVSLQDGFVKNAKWLRDTERPPSAGVVIQRLVINPKRGRQA